MFSKLRNNLLNVVFEKLLFKDVQNHVNKIRKNIGLPAYGKYFFKQGYDTPNLVLHLSTPIFQYSRKEFPENLRFIGPVLVNQGTIAKNHDDLVYPAAFFKR